MSTQKLMYKCQGIVLLMVLVFLQLFFLIGMISLMMTVMLLKTNHEAWSRTIHLISAQHVLQLIENELILFEPHCMIPLSSVSNIKNMAIESWQREACIASDGENNHLYVIEQLGYDDCNVIIDEQTGKQMVAKFYRISLLMLNQFNQKLAVQSVMAVPTLNYSTCQTNPHLVTLGRQMWREI